MIFRWWRSAATENDFHDMEAHMKKRKEPESAFDELMPVDDLPGMALYFAILRAIG